MFDALGTENFERVLGELNAAIRMTEALGYDASIFYQRYESIKAALGTAVRGVHLSRSAMDEDVLGAIKSVLNEQQWIFTTSYDVVLYWAMGYPSFGFLCDLFWGAGNSFDPDNANVWAGYTPVYFLHGALHLLVEGSGRTRKLTRNVNTILDQFARPVPGDPHARPLLVTEGSAQDKLRAIEANDYLTHALDQLQNCELPMVVFGSSLGDQDRHLVDAVNRWPDRPIAVSLMPDDPDAIRARQGELRGRLRATTLYFFDATTHPLGQPIP